MRHAVAALIVCTSLAMAQPAHGCQSPASSCPRAPERSFAVGEVTGIPDRTPPCRIEFRETGIRLEATADGSRPDPGMTVVVDSNGRFFTSDAPGWRAIISIWDARGRYLSHFGGAGEGPGELSARGGVELFIDSRDNLHARDGSFHWSVFTPEQQFLRRVRSNMMGGLPWTTVILDDGSALASDGLVSQEHYFRVTDSTGALARTFGPVDDGSSGRRGRPISQAAGDTFWAGPGQLGSDAYVVEEWGIDGTLRRAFRRDVSWYQWDGATEDAPRVTQIHITRGGLLYAVVWRPTERYVRERARAERRAGPVDFGELQAEQERMDEFTQLVLEVIDTRSGRLLASETYRTSDMREILPWGLFRGSFTGYRYKENEGGLPFVEIVTLELVAR